MIGITGTAGKTSTAYLVEAGLRAAGHVTGLIGTVETRLGDRVGASVRTTPEATDLHAVFAAWPERGVTAVVMEVSSHALALGRVGGVRFAVGGFTNFGPGPPGLPRRRGRLLRGQGAAVRRPLRVEVLNLDDAVRPAAGQAGHGHLLGRRRPGRRPGARPTSAGAGGSASASRVHGPDGRRPGRRGPLPGRHNVANALLALASLVTVGRRPALTAAGGVAACPRRARPAGAGRPPAGVLGVVDYAHKPDAVARLLAALRPATAGPADLRARRRRRPGPGKRPLMGAAAARGADVVIVTDDNPRTEDPAAIRAEVLAGALGVRDRREVIEVAGRRAAIDEAVRLAAPGDVVAVLGKGHERGQEIGGEVLPFDDRVGAGGGAGGADRERRPMIPLTLAEIADAVGGELRRRRDPVHGVTGDGRVRLPQDRPGGLFVAFAGEQVDGHDFAAGGGRGRRGRRARHPAGRACPTVVVADAAGGAGRAGPARCWTGCRS